MEAVKVSKEERMIELGSNLEELIQIQAGIRRDEKMALQDRFLFGQNIVKATMGLKREEIGAFSRQVLAKTGISRSEYGHRVAFARRYAEDADGLSEACNSWPSWSQMVRFGIYEEKKPRSASRPKRDPYAVTIEELALVLNSTPMEELVQLQTWQDVMNFVFRKAPKQIVMEGGQFKVVSLDVPQVQNLQEEVLAAPF